MTNLATIGFKADTRDLTAAEGRLRALETQGSKTEKGTVALMRQVGGLVAAYGGFRVAQDVIQTFAGFQQSMAEVQAITRANEAEFRALTDTARVLGATTEFTGSQAASALKFLGMAGFSAANAVKAVPEVLDLATAASMDLGRAADITSNIMSAFGIAADNASRVTDVLAASSSRANTDVDQLGAAMAYVGPVAAAMQVDVGKAAAAVGVLSDAGIQGSSAGTGLRRVLSSLANPTKEATRVLSDLGIGIEQVNPVTNELTEIVELLAARGITAADALTIFGDRGGPAILALVENSPRLAELTDILTDVEGEASRMANTMRDTLSGDIKTFQSAVESAQISLGDRFAPTLRDTAQAATDAARAVDAFINSDDFPKWINAAGIAVETLAYVLAAKLVISLGKSAAGLIANAAAAATATTATNVYGQRVVVATATQNAMTAASGKLKNALLLVGGPAGATVLVVAGLIAMITNMETAEDRSARLRTELQKLDDQETRNAIERFKRERDSAAATIARMEATSKGYAAEARAIDIQKRRLGEINSRIAEYERKLEGASEATGEFADTTDDLTGALGDTGDAVDDTGDSISDLTDETKKARAAVDEFIIAQRTELAQLQMTDLQRDISNALIRAGTERTGEQTAAIVQNAIEIHNQRQAAEDASEAATRSQQEHDRAAKAAAKAAADAARAIEEDWRVLRNSLSDFFADLMMEGGNAWDNLAKSAERAIYKIVGDVAASGLLSMLTGEKFDLGTILGNSGTSGRIVGGFLQNIGLLGGGGGAAITGNLSQLGAEYLQMSGVDVAAGSTGGGGGMLGALGTAGKAVGSWLGIGGGATTGAVTGAATGATGAVTGAAGSSGGGGILSSIFGGGGGAAGGSSGLASVPVVGWVAAGILNELNARKAGIRDENDWDYAQDLIGGKVLEQDIQKGWIAQMFGSDKMGLHGDMKVGADLATLDFSNAIRGLGQSSLAKMLGVSGGTPSWNAGLLLHDLPALGDDRKFAIDPFESGLSPVGFNRRTTAEKAGEVVDFFRSFDSAITQVMVAAGHKPNAGALQSALSSVGLDEKGQGRGIFLGAAGEQGGKGGQPLEQQIDAYARAYLGTFAGQVGSDVMDYIMGANKAEDMIARAVIALFPPDNVEGISTATNGMASSDAASIVDGSHRHGLDYVPFDGYRAELHRGERVQTATEVASWRAIEQLLDKTVQRIDTLSSMAGAIFDAPGRMLESASIAQQLYMPRHGTAEFAPADIASSAQHAGIFPSIEYIPAPTSGSGADLGEVTDLLKQIATSVQPLAEVARQWSRQRDTGIEDFGAYLQELGVIVRDLQDASREVD